MLLFSNFLLEAKKNQKEKEEEEFDPGDAAGKIWEILKGKFHNNGKFAQDFRVEGKKPEDIHNIMAEKLFGKQFENHPIYNNIRNSANESAEMLERYLAGNHGHDRDKGFRRVSWTSQPSDPSKFLGKKTAKSVADTMVETSDGTPHAISEKVTAVGSPINYANPGAKTFEGFSGLVPGSLTKHNAAHQKTMADIMRTVKTGETQKQYIKRITRKSKDPEKELGLNSTEMKHRQMVIDSYNTRNKNYGRDMRAGITKMAAGPGGDQRIRDSIFNLVTPSRETPTTVSHTELNPDGTVHRHRAYDVHDHVNQYLNQFEGFHIKQSDDDPASVTIHARHKTAKDKDGNPLVLPVVNLAVYGRKHDKSPRGSTNLRSENHPAITYTGELDSHGINGNSYEQHARKLSIQQPPSQEQKAAAITSQEPEHIENTQGVVDWLSNRARKSFSEFKPTQQKRVSQTGSPFQSMARPGIKRPPPSQRVATNGYPEHMHQAHRENSVGGYQDTTS